MVKKFVSYVAVATMIIGGAVLPSMADDSTVSNVLRLSF